MKSLIAFSLKRRFINATSLVIHVIFLTVIGCAVFSDHIINAWFPSLLQPTELVVNEQLSRPLNSLLDGLDFKISFAPAYQQDTHPLYLAKENNDWKLYSRYQVEPQILQKILLLVQDIEYVLLSQQYSESTLSPLIQAMHPNVINIVANQNQQLSVEKQHLVFMLLSTIYFMMLGFCSIIATEVVNEKSFKVLEIILTSVSAKTHFLSKIIIGWLTIIIQLGLNGLEILLWLVIRNQFDQGEAFIQMLKRMSLLPLEGNTFTEIIAGLNLSMNLFLVCFIILLFFFVGILFVQVIMVILSSYVNSVEESSGIQGPCYIVLLAIYYFALMINTPYHMTEGIGYYLSFCPFFSMIFMPCRLILQTVPWFELLLSFIFSAGAFILLCSLGSRYYEKGILNQRRQKQPLL